MSCVKVTPQVQLRLESQNTADVFTTFTEWLAAMAMDDATITMKMWNTSNNFRATPAVQTAEIRTDKPDAPAAIGSLVNQTADGEYFFEATTVDLAAHTAGATFVRFGVIHDVSSVPNLGQADVTLQVAYRQCGALQAPWSGTLVATTSDNHFVPIGGWMPALGVTALEGTIVVTSLSGGLSIDLTYRTAVATPGLPGAWATSVLVTPITAAGESNTGEQAVAVTDRMWLQPGLRFWRNTGTFAQAEVSVVLGVRSSS